MLMEKITKTKITQTKIQPEARKFPFEQTFLCPKCSEIMLTQIYYIKKTTIPQVHYTCPKKHSGNVDLPLFFNLFHSSSQEIEEELSKFDEILEKDIELFKNKKMKDKKIEPINFSEISKNKKNKEKEKNKEEDKVEEEINQTLKDIERNQLTKEIKRCSEIEFSLLKTKKKTIEPTEKPLLSKSESKTKETTENNNSYDSKKIKQINSKSNKSSFSPKAKTNNINIIKKRSDSNKKLEEKKEEEENKKEEEKTEDKKETAEQKETNEDKYMCSYHGSRYTGFCFSCKKDMCKKCFKKRGHKKRKIFSNILLSEKNLNDLNKSINQCHESLNKFDTKSHALIEGLSNKERNEKIILNIMAKAYIDINKDNLKEIKETIKTYVNCVKKSLLNYETIMSVKNLEIKNVIKVPSDILDLIKILKNYKNCIIQKNTNKKNMAPNDIEKNLENKYVQLFDAFFDILKKYENKEINFKEIVEDENFRKIINSNDYGEIEISKNESKNCSEEEKEINEMEKMEEFDMNYIEDGYENYEEYLEEEEEEENELEYENDYDNYNAEENEEDIEDAYNYVMDNDKKFEEYEKKEKEAKKG